MLFPTKMLVVAGLIMISCSCASIVSKSVYPVTIDSEPRGAYVVITNRRGSEVFKGGTPTTVKLKPGGGFFQRAIYDVAISKDGYVTKRVAITASFNGWYIGNLVFGGVIGFLIVDPATGAMYKLKDVDVNETLVPDHKTAAATPPIPQLKIYDINEIPVAWKNKLVAIK